MKWKPAQSPSSGRPSKDPTFGALSRECWTVNSACYIEILIDKWKPAIWSR